MLVVDDDPTLRAIQGLALDHLGCDAVLVASAERALELMDGVELVLTDVHLAGGMDGISFARELRRRGITVPIVGISGDELSPDEALDHLERKPVSVRRLGQIVRRFGKGEGDA